MSPTFNGNLSKAHKRIKQADNSLKEVVDVRRMALVYIAIGFLHVAIEISATFRDLVKNQIKESG